MLRERIEADLGGPLAEHFRGFVEGRKITLVLDVLRSLRDRRRGRAARRDPRAGATFLSGQRAVGAAA